MFHGIYNYTDLTFLNTSFDPFTVSVERKLKRCLSHLYWMTVICIMVETVGYDRRTKLHSCNHTGKLVSYAGAGQPQAPTGGHPQFTCIYYF